MARNRVLVVFVDALGPRQLEQFGRSLESLPHRGSLRGILGYTSGALPTILTGVPPAEHGRMCLFSRASASPGVLRPLTWIGLLPRFVHERQRFRRILGRAFVKATGITGYVALHKVPPEMFRWLDLPEREDMFNADRIGPAATFLADARQAGLEVYAAPWQLPEEERWANAQEVLRRHPPDLAFLYAPMLDATLHQHGNGHVAVQAVARRIAERIEMSQEMMGRGADGLLTIVVGDHGMADVVRVVDPRPLERLIRGAQIFVDSTMLRLWGDGPALEQAREAVRAAEIEGTWLDEAALAERQVALRGYPFGRAMFVLPEGHLFAPSYLGGRLRGMHGYEIGSLSSLAAIASNRPLPDDCAALTDVAGVIRRELGLSSEQP